MPCFPRNFFEGKEKEKKEEEVESQHETLRGIS